MKLNFCGQSLPKCIGTLRIIALVGALALFSTPGLSQGCPEALLNRVAGIMQMPPDFALIAEEGGESFDVWVWVEGEQRWGSGRIVANATGLLAGNHEVALLVGNCDEWEQENCAPAYLAKVFKLFAHEILHFKCPGHPSTGNVKEKLGSNKPTLPGSPPSCNQIAYALNTATMICDEIGEALECWTDPECPGIVDEETGEVIVPREDLLAYIAALEEQHQSIQDKFNNEGTANKAYECNCPSGWTPGTQEYPDCPPTPTPPDCSSATAAYPPDPGSGAPQVIPECSSN